MKKILTIFNLYVLLFTGVYANETITIAASPTPHAEILKYIKPILKNQGIDLEIKEINDYVQPNLLVGQKQLDANFFQHQPYLTEFNKTHNLNLVSLVAVEIEPMALYYTGSKKVTNFIKSKSATQLVSGTVIIIPNDTVNEARALNLLQQHQLIKLKQNVKFATVKDVVSNPYKVIIKELDPAILPRILLSGQADLALINSNYAISANLNPLKDSVFIESKNSPYANLIAIRPEELQERKMLVLAKIITSQQTRNFIFQKYKGAIIPAF